MPETIFRYVSDLHLERRDSIDHPKITPFWDFPKDDDDIYYLALIGDIGNPYQNNLKLFFDKISPMYEKIFYVTGNHEYYNIDNCPKSKKTFDDAIIALVNTYSNIVLLNNDTYIMDDIKIIGSTLWSHVPEQVSKYIVESINDYRMIKKEEDGRLVNITTADTNRWNDKAIAFIQKEINESDYPCIVLTHYAPLFSNKHDDQYTANPLFLDSGFNCAFHNDLKDMLKCPVVAWFYGHTHYTNRFKYNNIIIGTNQLGYSHEEKDSRFSPYAYLNIDRLLIDIL